MQPLRQQRPHRRAIKLPTKTHRVRPKCKRTSPPSAVYLLASIWPPLPWLCDQRCSTHKPQHIRARACDHNCSHPPILSTGLAPMHATTHSTPSSPHHKRRPQGIDHISSHLTPLPTSPAPMSLAQMHPTHLHTHQPSPRAFTAAGRPPQRSCSCGCSSACSCWSSAPHCCMVLPCSAFHAAASWPSSFFDNCRGSAVLRCRCLLTWPRCL